MALTLAILTIATIVLALIAFYRFVRSRSEESKGITAEEIKRKGRKIHVDLLKCEIKTNHYTEERDKYAHLGETGRDLEFLNAITGNEMDNVEQVKVLQSVLVYEHEGKTYYSHIIPKDEVTLSFLLEFQKETFIYVDVRTGDYYFDVDFLYKNK